MAVQEAQAEVDHAEEDEAEGDADDVLQAEGVVDELD